MDKIFDIPSGGHFISLLALPQSTKEQKKGLSLINRLMRDSPFFKDIQNTFQKEKGPSVLADGPF